MPWITSPGGAGKKRLGDKPQRARTSAYRILLVALALAVLATGTVGANSVGGAEGDAITTGQINMIVMKPNGGELWCSGTTQNITFYPSSATEPLTVLLEYSVSGPAGPFSTIVNLSGRTQGPQDYMWTVSAANSTNAYLRAQGWDAVGSYGVDISNNAFTFCPSTGGNGPPGAPTRPTGPSAGVVGAAYRYDASAIDPDGDDVKLTFDWGDGKTTETPFAGSGNTSGASHSWTAPGSFSVRAMATDVVGLSGNWSPTYNVTINNGQIGMIVMAPNGGERWCSGTTQNITFYPNGATEPLTVLLEYSVSGPAGPFSTIVNLTNRTQGPQDFAWTVSAANTTNAYVRAQGWDATSLHGVDLSNDAFTLCPSAGGNEPPEAPTQPSGPSAGVVGTPYRYDSSAIDPDGDNVKLKFDWGDGKSNETPFTSSGNTTGASHSWTAPGSFTVRAMATDAANRSGNWSSSRIVTIDTGQIGMRLMAPNGGESWCSATTQNVTFYPYGATEPLTVLLEYSVSGPAGPFSTIVNLTNRTQGPQDFAWTVSAANTTNAYVRAQVWDATGRYGVDISDNPFTLCADGNEKPRLVSVGVSPPGATLQVGQSMRFTASATDQLGRSYANATISWSLTGNVGAVDPSLGNQTLLQATRKGTGKLTASASEASVTVSAEVTITVNRGKVRLGGEALFSDGGPAAGANVRAFYETGDSPEQIPGTLASETTAAANGSWSLEAEFDADGDTFRVEATLPGYQAGSQSGISAGSPPGAITLSVRPRPATPSFPSWWPPVLIGLATIGAVIAALVIGGEALIYALALASISLYSRLRRETILNHFIRGQIYGHIRTHPGTHYREIRRVLGVANGVLAFHLNTLEREGFVKNVRAGVRKLFYPIDATVPAGEAISLSELQRRIVEHLRGNQGTSQVEIADALGMPRQSLNYNVKQLERMGIIRIQAAGRTTRCYAVLEAGAPGASPPGRE